MTYSCSDQSDRLIELLGQKGYVICHGDGYNTRTMDEELPEIDPEDATLDEYDANIDGCWFTWTDGKVGTEVGPTQDDELAAWSDAMEHWFENAKIPTEQV
jgi:hypothetical protein